MDTQKDNAETSAAYFNIHNNSVQPSSSVNHLDNCHFGKSLAYRAVYRCIGTPRNGSRKARGNDPKASPSRLSKVSLAADNTQD
ncbi:hypothetical protein HN51_054313 [Arachis hypogaea]|uniref:Uncharacterized protein n=1 Tax=Arachis hypogaea TaxID=3818 RepID=A0A444XHY9_ARAHY|nr:hypothetical protein Ahy_B09g095859 [Arachis hypogaea]